jgi:hypothetical protein
MIGSQELTAQKASRQTAIEQYIRGLDEVAEPLRKLVGHTRVDLLELAFEMRDRIKEGLVSQLPGLEAIDPLLPLVEIHLKYHRLLQHYHQIDVKLAMRGESHSGQRSRPSEKSTV